MSRRKVWIAMAIAAVAVLALTGAALASGTLDDGEAQLSGSQAEQAKAAALGYVPGTVGAVERDGENGATYEVEITKADGSQVDVRLDEAFRLVATDGDPEGPERSDSSGE